ncbi:hypothetical protein [Fluviispira vulneris]|uniref:hypothetical protein n=1 Tax=Fluviispira vulneris TaxID=2763012 RepID=UPI0016445CAE|nr:hypothetical protein [Fluviispira vulneris]
MFKNRINSKTNYILITAIAATSFIVARKTVSKIPAEIKIERVIDIEATRLAIEHERLKLRSEFNQIRTRDIIKTKNGTLKVHEKVQMQKSVVSEAVAEKIDISQENIHATEKIELKTALKKFSFEAESSLKNEVPNFSAIPKINPDLNIALKLGYRLDSNLWIFLGLDHELRKNNNQFKLGATYRLEF